MKGFYLKVRAVTRDEKPMADLITEELDRTDGRKFAAKLGICGIGALRKDKPNAIVPRRFLMIAEHTYYAVTQVDGKTGKHPTHLGIQWRERFQNKRVRGLLFWFGGMAHDLFTQTITGRIPSSLFLTIQRDCPPELTPIDTLDDPERELAIPPPKSGDYRPQFSWEMH